jgi:lysozyme
MKVNRGDFEGAAESFLDWTKAGGRVLKGLVTRRNDERAVFLS